MTSNSPVPPAPARPATDPPPPPVPAGQTPSPHPGRRRPDDRRARHVGWGLALIAAGTLWLLSLAAVPIRWALVLPAALVAIGILLLAGGRRTGDSGLIGLGIVVAVVALAVSVTPAGVPVSAGDRTHTVTDVADLESPYRLGAGSLTVDLRDVELPEGTTELTAEVGMGELIVRVPPATTVEGDGRVAMGEIVAFEDARGGIAPTLTFTEPGNENGRVLVLDLRVGLGSIEVDR